MNTSRKKSTMGRILTYSSIGIQIGFTIGMGIIGGIYLDRWLDTKPWLILLGLVAGVVSGFARLYQIGKDLSNTHRRDHRDSKDE